jgi:hypothetical protein
MCCYKAAFPGKGVRAVLGEKTFKTPPQYLWAEQQQFVFDIKLQMINEDCML